MPLPLSQHRTRRLKPSQVVRPLQFISELLIGIRLNTSFDVNVSNFAYVGLLRIPPRGPLNGCVDETTTHSHHSNISGVSGRSGHLYGLLSDATIGPRPVACFRSSKPDACHTGE